jgi:hypothetical protein
MSRTGHEVPSSCHHAEIGVLVRVWVATVRPRRVGRSAAARRLRCRITSVRPAPGRGGRSCQPYRGQALRRYQWEQSTRCGIDVSALVIGLPLVPLGRVSLITAAGEGRGRLNEPSAVGRRA